MFRDRIKNLIADVLYHTGLSPWLVSRRFRGQMVVLMYHRILPACDRGGTFSHDSIIVEPVTFDRHMAVLSRFFACLSLDEFAAALQGGGRSDKPACLLTFDDAWRDNYMHAFDILKKWEMPAVIFVPTDYIGTGRLFWQERLGHIVDWICARFPDSAARLLEKYGWSHLATVPEQLRRGAIKTAIRAIKHKGYSEIDAIIDDLAGVLSGVEVDYGPDRYLSVDEMCEMMRHGITFQSHGCSHRVFPRLARDELGVELKMSRSWLREQLAVDPIALAYPNGDHTPEIQQKTEQAGYRLAFTTIPGCVEAGAEPFTLRRINISDHTAGTEARLLMTLLLAGR